VEDGAGEGPSEQELLELSQQILALTKAIHDSTHGKSGATG
jgi:hypothetical protein